MTTTRRRDRAVHRRPAGPRTRRDAPRHARRRRGRRVVRATALALVTVLMAGASGAAAVYTRLQGAIDRADVDAYLTQDRPSAPEPPGDGFAGRPLNVLLMGTDLRDESNAALAGDDDTMNADTTILVHLSADRTRVELVSVPRDSLVRMPACTRPDGSTSAPRESAMFNAAFAVGAGGTEDLAAAAACTRLTFEENTGLRTDESVVLKMDGVVDVVEALGGIPVDLPEAVHSPKAGLALAAGPQVLDGIASLAFLRARTGTGMGLEIGSDLGRIERQHLFLDAFAAHVGDAGVLADPTTLLPLLTSVLASLSLSEGLADVRALAGLGFALRDLTPDDLTAVTVPVQPAPGNPNRVVWRPEAEDLWQRLREDRPLVDPEPAAVAGPGHEAG